MALPRTTIEGYSMPVQFSYELPIQTKRQSFHPTMSGVKWVVDSTEYPMDVTFSWQCNNCTGPEINTIRSAITWGSELTFRGHYGDALEVATMAFDNIVCTPGIAFDVSGSFIVISVTTMGGTLWCNPFGS